MQLPFFIARKYIFSKKSTNAINIISGISIFGMCIGSMALIVILSVFNGFEGLLEQLIGNFKPDVMITAQEGKVFEPDSSQIAKLKDLEGILAVSSTLEEISLVEYKGIQQIARIKGVDEFYKSVSNLDTCITSGSYKLKDDRNHVHYALIGSMLEHNLDVNISIGNQPQLTIYMPKRTKKNLSTFSSQKPFKKRKVYPSGSFSIQQAEYDAYLITDLAFVQELNSYNQGEISAIELKLDPVYNSVKCIQKIQDIMGVGYLVRNRYQQDEALFKITNLEKYIAYLIFSFTLILVAFNMIGALWMLVLEKKEDISILKSMGADNKLIKYIFLTEGLLMSLIGLVTGCLLAFVLCLLQQQYGFIGLGTEGNFIIDAYPVEMQFTDFLLVILTVLGIGLIAAWIPAKRATRIGLINRKD